MTIAQNKLDVSLAALATMSSAQLRAQWVSVTGQVVPKVSPAMLRLALGWEIQAKMFGGHSRATFGKLTQLAAASTRTSPAVPGMRLVREWNGVVHIVTVGEDRVIRWNDRDWNSLSEVARAITGTRWSGPAFFGLKQKVKAA
ncbi:DUF2924 domain-containing protein [Sphingomonas sp. SUN019]|uniref:DUF2924 domain-containing protein n=1 Tax=Sphingomonas sp. SUN019 TaxID=2937788 RepID=UPI0021645368|nr:DUF2924 domain-containing protein [Sphingomonas sp. SUN019]UVO50188.1 DUF2924 domain-containing protein [Sphingomonas sp. SUN019]